MQNSRIKPRVGLWKDYKKWVEDHRALCKKEGVKLVWDGIAYTTVESYAFFYDTDIPLDEFHKFKAKIFALQGGGIIKYGKTHMFLTYPWNF